uniref:Uncharacterized protein n=1 Tax=Dictyoglomus thermophilum TaxID=14 RepID=A0A7C3MKE1_DICTH
MRNKIRFFKKHGKPFVYIPLFLESIAKFIINFQKFSKIDLFKALFLELFVGNIEYIHNYDYRKIWRIIK